ncbi:uncharacterized protein LOC142765950 [Rhipicephalus microplus]|uniref:uncharacterized protein LOC142765950 n=1 Tax=Rhipicephalus microplus TaxID=6941 RepID=UPI003F6D2CD9
MSTPPPLLCSVGSQAAIPLLFPPDQSCDIVIYTHVRIFNNTVVGTVNDISLIAFLNACKTYKFSSCGFSFELGDMDKDQFMNTEIRDNLKNSKEMNRVQNYGILNLYGWQGDVENYTVTSVPSLLMTLRSLLGEDRHQCKLFVGIGYYLYNNTEAWSKLQHIADNVATPAVDILVLMTTVLNMPSPDYCITLPINAYKSQNVFTPTMDNAATIAKATFKPSLIVAFALQMGVVMYLLPDEPDTPNDALYQRCESFYLTDYSQLFYMAYTFWVGSLSFSVAIDTCRSQEAVITLVIVRRWVDGA